MPTCHSYDEVVEQRRKVDSKRQEELGKVEESLEKFNEEESKRRCAEDDNEEEEAHLKSEEELREVHSCTSVEFICKDLAACLAGSFQMKERRVEEGRRGQPLSRFERAARDENYEEFVMECREIVARPAGMDQIRATETSIDDFMNDTIPEYVPLKYHNFRYEMRAQWREFSKETPNSEKSVYNLYVGGERQSDENVKALHDRLDIQPGVDTEETADKE